MTGWFTKQRADWIVETVRIFGFINRRHIRLKFGVSSAQAALDLRDVNRRLPDLMTYVARTKRYELRKGR